ncbi:hypothetical protein, unlikely [Trypanosoma brucei gambiense DAL972]|uniref:Uncharacterized protein n=1 Tax=Trypanosoma brucei gambiense (strain MHOM/CI/86/DAL972) TaxID=679716 RepID=D0A912_TRYB9|nr:hypothetical protein, unlikely [Trypanosoma brucei gambiense DAL972]CBH18163.1 hypothetical protein, unlikely [Trypanosoma brucei gambiense DAL972]|eukprot:XP_011780427.1 hypothetical protein, unlikely [Trypanosoma brucei gambiense DAL972]
MQGLVRNDGRCCAVRETSCSCVFVCVCCSLSVQLSVMLWECPRFLLLGRCSGRDVGWAPLVGKDNLHVSPRGETWVSTPDGSRGQFLSMVWQLRNFGVRS